MRITLIISWFCLLTAKQCGHSKTHSQDNIPLAKDCFRGVLIVKGPCMNYVIQLTEGEMDTAKIDGHWKDPETNKLYQNVFALGNRCGFPDSIKEGDEFYFKEEANPAKDCMVCQVFRAVPRKHLSIQVLSARCK